jgi:N-acetylglutamate synthase-like GNAT family acetyltransferase
MLREIKPGGAEFQRFVAALTQADLPTDDLNAEPFRYFSADEVAWGGVGLGADALIRSVVVAPQARGRRYGVAVVEGLVYHAREARVERLWLLTTSAAPFFERLGWRTADRLRAPVSISQSRQFSDLCPASATLMVREL